MKKIINAGKYNKKIKIFNYIVSKDDDGIPKKDKVVVISPHAEIKTTKGYTLIVNNSSFEKAYTNFTIRFPIIPITRDMYIEYNNKIYTIEYLNDIDEKHIELEIQAKEITK